MLSFITGETFLCGFESQNCTLQNLKDYLISQRELIRRNPQLVRTTQNPNDLIQMYDYAINNFDNSENRALALRYLAEVEHKLINDGNKRLNGVDLEDYESLDELVGYWDVIERMANSSNELGFLGKTWWEKGVDWGKEKISDAKDTVKNVADKAGDAFRDTVKNIKTGVRNAGDYMKEQGLHALNKLNPTTILMRNSFRALVALNFLGIAGTLVAGLDDEATAKSKNYDAADWKKRKDVADRVLQIYSQLGGKKSKIQQAIKNGSKRKAIFGKEKDVKIDDKDLKVDGLGEPVTTAAIITSAVPVTTAVIKMLADSGLMKKEDADKITTALKNGADVYNAAQTDESKKIKVDTSSTTPSTTPSQNQVSLPTVDPYSTTTSTLPPNTIPRQNAETPKTVTDSGMPKWVIPAIVVSAVGVGAAYFYSQKNNKNTRKQTKQTLSGVHRNSNSYNQKVKIVELG